MMAGRYPMFLFTIAALIVMNCSLAAESPLVTANNSKPWPAESDKQPASIRLSTATQIPGEALRGQRYVYVDGYHRVGDGGAGYYEEIETVKSADKAGLEALVAADGSLWRLLTAGVVNVRQFGATGTGEADDTQAFVRALSAAKVVLVPAGTYFVSKTIHITKSGTKLRGDGPTASAIVVTAADQSGISAFSGLNNLEISGLTISRRPSPGPGAYGIDLTSVTVGQSVLRDLVLERHFRNLGLGATDFSLVRDVISQEATDTGVFLTNTPDDGTCQWTLENVLSQKNGGDGYFLQARSGPRQVTLGPWRNISSYANSGHGLAVVGQPRVGVHGVRITGGFLGSDGRSELFLDTFGGQHLVTGTYTELAGRAATGPSLKAAPTGMGHGIEVTRNNASILIDSTISNGNSHDGYYLEASSSILSDSRGSNNGLALAPGRRSGVSSPSGRLLLTGGVYSSTGGNRSQLYGVSIADPGKFNMHGADLSGNASGPIQILNEP